MSPFEFKIERREDGTNVEIGWVWIALPILIAVLLLSGCGAKPVNNYNNGWGQHYYNGKYDPFYNYGLGTYVQNNRTYYIVPTQTPPKSVKTATSAPKTTAPMPTGEQPKPTTQAPAAKTTQPKANTPKVDVNKPKPVSPPKAAAPKPAAPKSGK